MKQSPKQEAFSSIKLPKKLIRWLKVEAAKADVAMYQIVVRRFPEVSLRGDGK